MDLNLENKVAIVTGGSEGLGKAIAISLSLEGVKVANSAREQQL
jgi:3-oxoacyl-[acyl-carrier protein] reductase